MSVRDFNEYLREGIVKRQAPDHSRANYLREEAAKSHNILHQKIEKLGITDELANDLIKNCYDILMELLRATMLDQGYNASGRGAHEAEVSYLRELNTPEHDVQFANQLRYLRNGMLYYGKELDKEYAKKVIAFTEKLYRQLQ